MMWICILFRLLRGRRRMGEYSYLGWGMYAHSVLSLGQSMLSSWMGPRGMARLIEDLASHFST